MGSWPTRFRFICNGISAELSAFFFVLVFECFSIKDGQRHRWCYIHEFDSVPLWHQRKVYTDNSCATSPTAVFIAFCAQLRRPRDVHSQALNCQLCNFSFASSATCIGHLLFAPSKLLRFARADQNPTWPPEVSQVQGALGYVPANRVHIASLQEKPIPPVFCSET